MRRDQGSAPGPDSDPGPDPGPDPYDEITGEPEDDEYWLSMIQEVREAVEDGRYDLWWGDNG